MFLNTHNSVSLCTDRKSLDTTNTIIFYYLNKMVKWMGKREHIT